MEQLIEYMVFFLIFGSILFLAFVTTKLVGKKVNKGRSGAYISVVETINIGLDKQLHLLKVADQFVLIASSGKNIQFLTNVKLEEFEPESLSSENSSFNFANVFEKYLQGFKGTNDKERVINDQPDKKLDKYSSIFNNNLSRLKNINSSVEKYTGVNEDEDKNSKQ